MKKYFFFMVLALISLSSCQSEQSQAQEKIIYTYIKDCVETVENENAAFSELSCPDVGSYKLNITQQSPMYFNVVLSNQVATISTDFTSLTNESPLEPGTAIEWHLVQGEPRFMIFRLSWGSQEQPFNMQQYLTINLVESNGICSLAVVRVSKHKNANQKARDVLNNQKRMRLECPNSIIYH